MAVVDLGLNGRACIVTGASRGIGAAVARMLAEEGAGVLLVGRDRGPLEEVAASLPGRAVALELDVTGEDAGERAVGACERELGRVDVLVNNAGTSFNRPLEELTDSDWELQWRLNVIGPHRLMRAAAPVMAKAGWGRIVNVASSSGKRPSATNVAYSVTKSAQLALSRAYADRWAPEGVLVNAVAPGPVATGLWTGEGGLADQSAAADGTSREEVIERAGAKLPVGRLGGADEIASVVTLLCSERAAFVAGAAWSVDGGGVATIV